jgi:hypothetical protein
MQGRWKSIFSFKEVPVSDIRVQQLGLRLCQTEHICLSNIFQCLSVTYRYCRALSHVQVRFILAVYLIVL